MKNSLDILKQYWGFDSFREPQAEIIQSVLHKKDTVALLPTGGGKSICFQVPALLLEGICIVISPMVSLIKDQVENLQEKGIRATTIEAGASHDAIVRLFDNLKYGNYSFLYLSPERLSSGLVKEKLKELKVSLIVVDEAHCISEWGHDFRPSYRRINDLREIHPYAHYIALTATATQEVLKDIIDNLKLDTPHIYRRSFARAELSYKIIHAENKLEHLLSIFKHHRNPAIVYVRSRKRAMDIARFLCTNGFEAVYYHGGRSVDEKAEAFQKWMSESANIMVATNAFGMGIDKSNVSTVVHLDLPYSLENYIQEAGRAGRDGRKSSSIVLQNNNDVRSMLAQVESTTPSISEIKHLYKNLHQYFQIGMGELSDVMHPLDIQKFCERYDLNYAKTNAILKILVNNGVLDVLNSNHQRSSLQFCIPSAQLIDYKNQSESMKLVIDTILRNYPGIYEQPVQINEFSIAKKAKVTSSFVSDTLRKMNAEEIVKYSEVTADLQILFLVPREDDRTINPIVKNVKSYLHMKSQKATTLINFIQNNSVCRSVQLLSYFGEDDAKECGLCDVCLEKNQSAAHLEEDILNLLRKEKELSSIEIQTHLEANEKDILIHLQNLLADSKISINRINKYNIK